MKNTKPILYLAAPLFSMAELEFNQKVENNISDHFDIFLPQRDGGLMDQMIKQGTPAPEASAFVFSKDLAAIRCSNVVLAVLDGRSIDEGVSVELGFAYALNKKCFGIQTGPIRLFPSGNNPMIENVLEDIFCDFLQLRHWAESFSLSRQDIRTPRLVS